MPYALLQTSLQPPPVEALRRAFQKLEFLTKDDAGSIAHDAFGILIDRMSLEHAEATRDALSEEGVSTVVVDRGELDALPAMMRTRQIDAGGDQLVIFDQYNRPRLVEWSSMTLIAAGLVGQTRSKPGETAWTTGFSTVSMVRGGGFEPLRTDDETTFEPRLELFFSTPPHRVSADADRLNYTYLGDRRLAKPQENFPLLVRDLVKRAPGAMVSRGAQSLADESPDVIVYPTQRAFDEEMIWLFWHASQSGEKGARTTEG